MMALSQKGSSLLVTVILRKLLETKSEKYVLGCTTICKKEKKKRCYSLKVCKKRVPSQSICETSDSLKPLAKNDDPVRQFATICKAVGQAVQ